MDVSKSLGTPSMAEEELVNCSAVASALDKYFNPALSRGIFDGFRGQRAHAEALQSDIPFLRLRVMHLDRVVPRCEYGVSLATPNCRLCCTPPLESCPELPDDENHLERLEWSIPACIDGRRESSGDAISCSANHPHQ